MTLCKAVGIFMEHPSVFLFTLIVLGVSVVEPPLLPNGVHKKDCLLFEMFKIKRFQKFENKIREILLGKCSIILWGLFEVSIALSVKSILLSYNNEISMTKMEYCGGAILEYSFISIIFLMIWILGSLQWVRWDGIAGNIKDFSTLKAILISVFPFFFILEILNLKDITINPKSFCFYQKGTISYVNDALVPLLSVMWGGFIARFI